MRTSPFPTRREGEIYHNLNAETEEEALQEAVEYLCDEGVPTSGNANDEFVVVQTEEVSKRISVKLSVLAAGVQDQKIAKEKLLKALKK